MVLSWVVVAICVLTCVAAAWMRRSAVRLRRDAGECERTIARLCGMSCPGGSERKRCPCLGPGDCPFTKGEQKRMRELVRGERC